MNQSLFLKELNDDNWIQYCNSVKFNFSFHWDYVYITASNCLQAEYFRKQILKRKRYLPRGTKIFVIPDKDNVRVGSGGATLSVIRDLCQKNDVFNNKRVLIIHSGGDSKRVPQYSALGKLFSPCPHLLPDGRLSTLFDEILISMASLPRKIKDGIVILSGDALLMFNGQQIEIGDSDAACFTFKEKTSLGQNHGVYLINNEDSLVDLCLQKWPEVELRKIGASDCNDLVNIDTGAIFINSKIVNSLYKLIDNDEKYCSLVNDKVRLSLYVDMLFPFCKSASLENYLLQKPEGSFCEELREARMKLWPILSAFNMKAISFVPAKFIHFGTSHEILNLVKSGVDDYSDLQWKKVVGCSIDADCSGYNSIVTSGVIVNKDSYLECSYIHSNSTIGKNSIISFLDVGDVHIPDDVVVHGLKLADGKYVVRIFGVYDNPKNNLIFGKEISSLEFGLDCALWDAEIYPIKDSLKDALIASLNVYNIAFGKGNFKEWKDSKKISLSGGFKLADLNAILDWEEKMEDLVVINNLLQCVLNNVDYRSVNVTFKNNKLTQNQIDWLNNAFNNFTFSQKIRLLNYLAYSLDDQRLYQAVFNLIKEETTKAYETRMTNNGAFISHQDHVEVKLPLRVNFAGGWTDTLPFSCENGGAVLNASILLNNELPVQVTIERIKERLVVFESKDMNSYGEFSDLRELQNTGDPYDSFALQKAALIATGIIPLKGGNINYIFDELDGGFKIDSEVVGVPKGSGLGTSSILSCAVVKAIYNFFNIQYTDNDLFQTVLLLEQIMSTGGGWQDQIGGAINGFKYITSKPGLPQHLSIELLSLSQRTLDELNDRFVLIYSGERRLARNILRNVVCRYLGNVPESIDAHQRIKNIAFEMRNCLLKDDVDGFINLYKQHLDESLKIDNESTSTLINSIFASIEDLVDAKMVVGAGGGGFVAAFAKKGVSKQQIQIRLKDLFFKFPIDVWDSKFIV